MATLNPPHLPSECEAQRARQLSERLARYAGQDLTLYINGETAPLVLGQDVLALLQEILTQTAMGRSVAVIPRGAELTTQEAADLLKVSRPFLVGLLEAGEIPHRKVGSHRRVSLSDLLAYQARAQAEQEEALRQLQQQAQKLKMGY
ncbi:helix-turn-helix domain-containing protein [uncultured Meiothermus sp.]|jgi:excisionase family DNA binding protein|uniref:helix-turn-helix domain-containing protein n=1 Tax=uncultured Meiothermus sp. TaxID=157471 RepID=UPI002605BCF8|nr:helix-turn-helix domain-containing protein [uncultured Meiothermus sp.]